jgi:ATP-dependent RNA helicase DeaD
MGLASLFLCAPGGVILATEVLVPTDNGFAGFELRPELQAALVAMGYAEPTEIQAQVLGPLLAGRDVMGQAQTGTGKTAAFGIPIVERADPGRAEVQALILAPTRELAAQIADELGRLAQFRGLGIALLYGGAAMGPQLDALQNGAQIVVGTPGRVLDHLGRGTLDLQRVGVLILDEADRMLDMGFMPDVERIIRHIPRRRQTALFSATMPLVMRVLGRRHMREPIWVRVRPEETTVAEVEQFYFEVADRDKGVALLEILKEQQPERAIVFRRTKIGVDRLVRFLVQRGVPVEALHGDMQQRTRERVLADFRTGKLQLLVATDVAARGLDVPEVTHVINADIPDAAEAYVHRIGRTARMGREGTAITFVSEWDGEALAAIQKATGGALKRGRLNLYS